MTIGDKLLLGVNTTLIGMGIVFLVLIALCFIVMFESYIFKNFKTEKAPEHTPQAESAKPVQRAAVSQNLKKGKTIGETVTEGVESDEELAAIMASVSFDADIPLNQLKIKKIRLM